MCKLEDNSTTHFIFLCTNCTAFIESIGLFLIIIGKKNRQSKKTANDKKFTYFTVKRIPGNESEPYTTKIKDIKK